MRHTSRPPRPPVRPFCLPSARPVRPFCVPSTRPVRPSDARCPCVCLRWSSCVVNRCVSSKQKQNRKNTKLKKRKKEKTLYIPNHLTPSHRPSPLVTDLLLLRLLLSFLLPSFHCDHPGFFRPPRLLFLLLSLSASVLGLSSVSFPVLMFVGPCGLSLFHFVSLFSCLSVPTSVCLPSGCRVCLCFPPSLDRDPGCAGLGDTKPRPSPLPGSASKNTIGPWRGRGAGGQRVGQTGPTVVTTDPRDDRSRGSVQAPTGARPFCRPGNPHRDRAAWKVSQCRGGGRRVEVPERSNVPTTFTAFRQTTGRDLPLSGPHGSSVPDEKSLTGRCTRVGTCSWMVSRGGEYRRSGLDSLAVTGFDVAGADRVGQRRGRQGSRGRSLTRVQSVEVRKRPDPTNGPHGKEKGNMRSLLRKEIVRKGLG